MYDEISYPVLVIQKFDDGKFQIDGFTTPEDGLAFFNFIKNHTDLSGITDLRLCVTVLQHKEGGIRTIRTAAKACNAKIIEMIISIDPIKEE